MTEPSVYGRSGVRCTSDMRSAMWCVAALLLAAVGRSAATVSPFALLGGGPRSVCDCLVVNERNAAHQQQLDALLAAAPSTATSSFDASNHSLLNMAAFYGNVPAVRSLIASGANVRHADRSRHTPLQEIRT